MQDPARTRRLSCLTHRETWGACKLCSRPSTQGPAPAPTRSPQTCRLPSQWMHGPPVATAPRLCGSGSRYPSRNPRGTPGVVQRLCGACRRQAVEARQSAEVGGAGVDTHVARCATEGRIGLRRSAAGSDWLRACARSPQILAGRDSLFLAQGYSPTSPRISHARAAGRTVCSP